MRLFFRVIACADILVEAGPRPGAELEHITLRVFAVALNPPRETAYICVAPKSLDGPLHHGRVHADSVSCWNVVMAS
jgi:hypothetical protein